MRRRRWTPGDEDVLEAVSTTRVRFQEVDSLRVVWHGHYLSYFEDGRNAFGRQYGLTYESILAAGYLAPLVHVELDFMSPSRFDELLEIRTRLHLVEGARVPFSYVVTGEDGERKVSGHTVQVFCDTGGELVLCRPTFYQAFVDRWKACAVPV